MRAFMFVCMLLPAVEARDGLFIQTNMNALMFEHERVHVCLYEARDGLFMSSLHSVAAAATGQSQASPLHIFLSFPSLPLCF